MALHVFPLSSSAIIDKNGKDKTPRSQSAINKGKQLFSEFI